jgi:hypothetical protein
VDHASATEIRIATPDDDLRLNRFIQGFLSDNGFPFIMVHGDAESAAGGGAAVKRVMFEDDEIGRRFRDAWRAQALGTHGRA